MAQHGGSCGLFENAFLPTEFTSQYNLDASFSDARPLFDSFVESERYDVVGFHPLRQMPGSELHKPVMVETVLDYLRPTADSIIIDGTLGTGGHAIAILPRLLPHGRLIAIDRDKTSLQIARERLIEFDPLSTFIHGNYRNLPTILEDLGVAGVDGVLLDLGMSSVQVDYAERGFSFSNDGPLDMRMDCDQETTAKTLIDTLTADELAMILRDYGEEPFSAPISKN